MDYVYISIEKDVKGFEFYKELWGKREIIGIMADTMTKGIEKAIKAEKSKAKKLYFVDIVEDDIDYMPQLPILAGVVTAPILIATSEYNTDLHHKANMNGADYYGQFHNDPEENISAVLKMVETYNRDKTRNKNKRSDILFGGDILISLSRRTVFVRDKEITLHKKEFDVLCYLIKNKGCYLTPVQILSEVWGEKNHENENNILSQAICRIRSRLSEVSPDREYIKVERNTGYKFLS